MMKVINGGQHAGNELSIQEVLILPIGFDRFHDNLRAGVETYHALKGVLEKSYGRIATNVADEGGYAPPMRETAQAFDAITEAMTEAGYSEYEIQLGMDAAASSFFNLANRRHTIDGKAVEGSEMIDYYQALVLNSAPSAISALINHEFFRQCPLAISHFHNGMHITVLFLTIKSSS